MRSSDVTRYSNTGICNICSTKNNQCSDTGAVVLLFLLLRLCFGWVHEQVAFYGRLNVWHLTLGLPIMHCDPQNTQHLVQVMSFNDLPYADLI